MLTRNVSLVSNARLCVLRNFHSSATKHTSKAACPVILSACRTPIGSFNSSLASFRAPELGSIVVEEAVQRAHINPSVVDEVFMGNVCPAGVGQAPARQAALNGGLPNSVPCTTVNKVCASGMKTLMLASTSISAGQISCAVAGGFESMSNIPHYLPKARNGYGYGHGEVQDGLIKDGLWDAFDDHHMGVCAEACATEFSITREEQDRFALESYRRAAAASDGGLFKEEIVPVSVPQRRGDPRVVDVDEEFSSVRPDKVPQLRPAFARDGTVTAANASSLNDGAAAFIVASSQFAEDNNLKPLARILGYADAAQEPLKFTTAPSLAIPKAIANAGLNASDIDYYEINQAFSVVSLANLKLLDLDEGIVDVNGGAVALGHPIGCSGARIVVTLLNVLKQRDGRYGVAGICNGGGGASAIVIERL